ncbi:4'-phosphopantetheinyl transferase family protein [Photobacterium sp.]|uniref:4'-phosphopantetheinyl transferase family protein n=1 Tax=Photobacterium sp. TaxID=660 RepID=UPI00299ED920|nr:4'-phosphopantetheinyl transferase superfamily protein [Photobacterium sp.]MDX1300802.1 4'-phosphopantetheinyl transferase superfamily protein [Photobacterium sp.]
MSSFPLVQLWFCPLTQLDDAGPYIDSLRRWLTEDELTKVDRYRLQDARTRALYVRGVLRAVLSRYAALSPDEWRFEYGEKGKPRLCAELRDQTGLEFNLSHSGGYLLLGVIRAGSENVELGVDIEHARTSTDIYPILSHYFSPQEVTALLHLPENRQRPRFFDLWALKESYIKATGLGLATSLKSFGFDLSAASKETLPIQSAAGPDSPFYSEPVVSQLELYRGIGLNFADNGSDHSSAKKVEPDPWQSCLGRLNEEYRFAVTLGGSAKAMALEARLISPKDLL